MITRFVDRVRAARNHRRRMALPRFAIPVTLVAAFTLVYIAAATGFVQSGELSAGQFRTERGQIAVLSGYYLVAAACFSFASFVIATRTSPDDRLLWLIFALAFAFLAMDETVGIHERIGRWMDSTVGPGVFRGWNDVVVILYGVVALPVTFVLLPALLRYRMVLALFVIAFGFYAIHTFIDAVWEPPTTTSYILEESAKLYSGAMLALGAFAGFMGSLWNLQHAVGPRP